MSGVESMDIGTYDSFIHLVDICRLVVSCSYFFQ